VLIWYKLEQLNNSISLLICCNCLSSLLICSPPHATDHAKYCILSVHLSYAFNSVYSKSYVYALDCHCLTVLYFSSAAKFGAVSYCIPVNICPCYGYFLTDHLRALQHIRASLPDDICLSLQVEQLYFSPYSTLTIQTVLYGTLSNLHKLQMVRNALARTITRSPYSVPTPQLLSNLHWLPIRKRINFKVATSDIFVNGN